VAGTLGAVLFDVDFTLVRPGPELGPEGYRRLGERFGLELDPSRYDDARFAAQADLKRHPELEHDDELWIAFTVDIIRGMGGAGPAVQACAVEMVALWEHSHNFVLFEDTVPALGELRRHRLRIGLVSNTGRNLAAFVEHHGLDVDVAVGSRAHGKTKPDPSIFEAALVALDVEASAAAMVGDSIEDDIEGALALGMRALLLDRAGRFPDFEPRLNDLFGLPAALGLVRA
jgi:HAD superfamily hydrolase (TIGR01549 family)